MKKKRFTFFLVLCCWEKDKKTQEKDDDIRVHKNEKCTLISEQNKLINVRGSMENEGEIKEEGKGSWGLGLWQLVWLPDYEELRSPLTSTTQQHKHTEM